MLLRPLFNAKGTEAAIFLAHTKICIVKRLNPHFQDRDVWQKGKHLRNLAKRINTHKWQKSSVLVAAKPTPTSLSNR
jgi:hypothetical protein